MDIQTFANSLSLSYQFFLFLMRFILRIKQVHLNQFRRKLACEKIHINGRQTVLERVDG